RLIKAKGRENFAAAGAPGASESEVKPSTFPHPPGSLRNYVQHYSYDEADNILELAHRIPVESPPTGSQWTRHYEYELHNNRLRNTKFGPTDADVEATYHYDVHGNMLNFARVAAGQHLRWDYRDMIHAVDLGGGGFAHY